MDVDEAEDEEVSTVVAAVVVLVVVAEEVLALVVSPASRVKRPPSIKTVSRISFSLHPC